MSLPFVNPIAEYVNCSQYAAASVVRRHELAVASKLEKDVDSIIQLVVEDKIGEVEAGFSQDTLVECDDIPEHITEYEKRAQQRLVAVADKMGWVFTLTDDGGILVRAKK